MVTRRKALVAGTAGLAAVALTLGGCATSPEASQLPDAARLASASAASLAELQSVRFEYASNGKAGVVELESATGIATRGGARGAADVVRHGEHTRFDFVLDGRVARLTDSRGEHRELTLPETFTLARLLSDDGLGGLLADAETLRTETREDLEGVGSYRLTGTLSRSVLATVLPGVPKAAEGVDDGDAISVKFWVGEGARHELLRVWLQLPPSKKNEGSVVVELGLSQHRGAGKSS